MGKKMAQRRAYVLFYSEGKLTAVSLVLAATAVQFALSMILPTISTNKNFEGDIWRSKYILGFHE